MTFRGFDTASGCLTARLGRETLELRALGDGAIRVRATHNPTFDETLPSGLLDTPPRARSATVDVDGDVATLDNGRLRAVVRRMPRGLGPALELAFHDTETGEVLLEEEVPHILYPGTRNFDALEGPLWRIEQRFRAHDDERFWGLGQHQHGRLDQKGCVIDLHQMNTEVVIPFVVSSRGYGLIWNTPGTGRVELAQNRTLWTLDASPQLDYVVIAGEPAEVLGRYAKLTGHPPVMPDWALGFWQCKLRYRTQDEVLRVAREYHRRGIPVGCFVIDFFNWTRGGEWRMDPADFPDPAAMVVELEEMGMRPMISIWPAVNRNAENFDEMRDAGYLIEHRRGVAASSIFLDAGSTEQVPLSFYDATHPGARAYHWDRVRQGYVRHGFKAFWLDANEPEVYPAHPDNMRYYLGEGRTVSGAYSVLHLRGIAEGMAAEGIDDGVLLSRSAWLGAQRYPVVVWSGDVHSTFADLARQVRAGLNMAMSGIPWWTTDIGGFKGGDIRDPAFHELLVRWFQYGVFCPIMRLHGFRQDSEGAEELGRDFLAGGADNEVWSFGPDVEAHLLAAIRLREALRPYLRDQMRAAHQTGLPPMRPLLLEFPHDPAAQRIDDQFLLGPDVMVAPILRAEARSRTVYLPKGVLWRDVWTGERHAGGQNIQLDAPLDRIPVLARADGGFDVDLSGALAG